MNFTKFQRLINAGEQENIDFKIECQALTKMMAPNAELAKDICAMANNKKISYVIIGVSDDGKNLKSVSNNKLTDDNLQTFCKQSIYPPPKIKLLRKRWKKVNTKYNNKEFVIIQITRSSGRGLAYHLAKDFIDYRNKTCYRHNEVWIRRGATSDLATPIEIEAIQKGRPHLEKAGLGNLEKKIGYSKATATIDKEKHFHRLVAAGMQYERVRRYDLAIDCFEDALKIKSNDIGLLHELSIIYGEIFGDPSSKKKAINYCKKILRIDKNHVSAKFNLAVYTSHIKGSNESFPIYEEAEALTKKQGLINTELYGKLNIFIGHDIRRLRSREEGKARYEKAISILKPLANSGDKTSEFWLKDAEKNFKEVTEEIEKQKKNTS